MLGNSMLILNLVASKDFQIGEPWCWVDMRVCVFECVFERVHRTVDRGQRTILRSWFPSSIMASGSKFKVSGLCVKLFYLPSYLTNP